MTQSLGTNSASTQIGRWREKVDTGEGRFVLEVVRKESRWEAERKGARSWIIGSNTAIKLFQGPKGGKTSKLLRQATNLDQRK